MSDEKLSVGGRPESRADFNQKYGHITELWAQSGGLSFEGAIAWQAWQDGRQSGERDMAERAAQFAEATTVDERFDARYRQGCEGTAWRIAKGIRALARPCCPECGLLDKHKMDCSQNPDRPITVRVK